MTRLTLLLIAFMLVAPAVASAQTAPEPYGASSPRPAEAPTATIALAYPCPVTMDDAMLMLLGDIQQSYVADDDYSKEWHFWESDNAPGASLANHWDVVSAGWSSVAWDYCNDHSRWIYYRTRLGHYLFTQFRVKPDTEHYWRDYVITRQAS
jgi:hypothetical protein